MEASTSLQIYLNSLFTFGEIIIMKQCERESRDAHKLVLPVTGEKTAEFGGWLGFADFPILPATNFNGINGYYFEMAPQLVRHL